MENKSTIAMILIATVLALGLTVYGEHLESDNLKQSNVVEESTLGNYKTIERQLKN